MKLNKNNSKTKMQVLTSICVNREKSKAEKSCILSTRLGFSFIFSRSLSRNPNIPLSDSLWPSWFYFTILSACFEDFTLRSFSFPRSSSNLFWSSHFSQLFKFREVLSGFLLVVDRSSTLLWVKIWSGFEFLSEVSKRSF